MYKYVYTILYIIRLILGDDNDYASLLLFSSSVSHEIDRYSTDILPEKYNSINSWH